MLFLHPVFWKLLPSPQAPQQDAAHTDCIIASCSVQLPVLGGGGSIARRASGKDASAPCPIRQLRQMRQLRQRYDEAATR